MQSIGSYQESKSLVLCDMPAASEVNPADLIALLKAALRRQQLLVQEALCKLPSALKIPADEIPSLVKLVKSRA